jgi:hypothetical protein
MKSPISIVCHNGHTITVEITGTQDVGGISCPDCGGYIWAIEPLGNRVSRRILNRAFAEFQKDDATLTILLCGVAVECELSGLFFKWTKLDTIGIATPTAQDEEAWEKKWRPLKISKRLDTASHLLTGKNFDALICSEPRLSKGFDYMGKGYSSPKQFFIEEFFYKRNKIAHFGEIDYTPEEAKACFTLSTRLFGILSYMDYVRIKAMDAKHAADRAALAGTQKS